VQNARSESGGVKHRPESIPGTREVVARPRGVQAGVDAAEQHIQIRRDDISNATVSCGE
jgi:hypothetical protein